MGGMLFIIIFFCFVSLFLLFLVCVIMVVVILFLIILVVVWFIFKNWLIVKINRILVLGSLNMVSVEVIIIMDVCEIFVIFLFVIMRVKSMSVCWEKFKLML